LLTTYRDSSSSPRSRNSSELPSEVIWIDLLNSTDDEKLFVENRTDVHIPSIEALSEIESSSRLIVERGVMYLSTPVVAQGDTADPFISPAGFILSSTLLVTVRFAELSTFQAVAEKISRDESLRSSTGVFTALMEALVDRGADVLDRSHSTTNCISAIHFALWFCTA
jgi:magnesium transporter